MTDWRSQNREFLDRLDPNIATACRLAAWSYQPDRATLPLPNRVGWDIQVRQHSGTDAQVIMAAMGDIVWLSFPGSVSLRDWFTNVRLRSDLDFGSIANGGDKPFQIHQGFQVNAAHMVKVARPFLRNHKPKKVHITGHSQGGATGLLAARYLIDLGVLPANCISVTTLGQPAVGGRATADYFSQLSLEQGFVFHRIVNAGDPVPTALRFFGYRQPQNLIYITREGDAWLNPPKNAFLKDHRPARIRGFFALLMGGGIPAHGRGTYLDRLGIERT